MCRNDRVRTRSAGATSSGERAKGVVRNPSSYGTAEIIVSTTVTDTAAVVDPGRV